jgi:chromosome segregation ATPase
MTTQTIEPMTLADRLAAAEAAAVPLRERVRALEAALSRAVSAGGYGQAAQIQAELDGARQQLAIADAEVRILQGTERAVADQRVRDHDDLERARRRHTAQAEIGHAIQAERQALDDLDDALDQFWALVAATQAKFREAQSCEQRAGAARQRVIDVRVEIGQMQAPGPKAAAPNKTSVLLGENPAVRAIVHGHR